jgi:lysyl endopeptidase
MRFSAVLLGLIAALSAASARVLAKPPEWAWSEAPRVVLPRFDAEAARLKAEAAAKPGVPYRFAEALEGKALAQALGKAAEGRWIESDDGSRRWLLAVEAPGARNLNFHFEPFRLPHGARLWIADPEKRQVLGPYDDRDNPPSGAFWTPILEGDRALILLELPPGAGRLDFAIAGIQRGFRDPFAAKAGACNIDVVCPEGEGWRDQIRAVASYTIGGSGLCSGTLMATTNAGENRVFSTANHCVSSPSQAASVVLYWRHEHPTCRAVNSSENGLGSIGPNNPSAIPQTGGAQLLANHPNSDFTLLRLNTIPPAAANVFLSGWDRRGSPRIDGATGIHHPQGHEKRISHTSQTLIKQDTPTSGLGQHHWRVPFWTQGTTEPGSSGSGLWNRDKRLIGVLSGGSASCSNPGGFDIYGRLETAWEGGGTPSSRARDHLDPTGSGVGFLDSGGCTPPNLNLEILTASPRAGEPVSLRATASGGGGGPYDFEWDVDGDGFIDRRETAGSGVSALAPLYPSALSTQVRVFVRDAAGCSALVTRALDVAGPRLDFSLGATAQLCGDADGQFDPGERFRVPVTVQNVGNGPLEAGRVLFQTLSGASTSGGPDGFGYTYADQNDGGLCPFQFLDISDGARLAVTPSGSFAANDDGRAGPISLSFPFDFYGQAVTQIVMSTNGYLSTSTAETGGQFQVNCNGAQSQGSVGGRIDPLQFDWLYNTGFSDRGLFHRFYSVCPRPPQVGPASVGCHVFQWNGMEAFDGNPAGRFDFQAILYQGSHQIVFQYRSSDPEQGRRAHVTIQNAANTQRLPYSCNQAGRIGPVRSVCYFHPSAQPSAGAAVVRLETPAPALPALAPGQQAVVNVDFKLADEAACGAPVRFRMLGASDGPRFAPVQGAGEIRGTIAAACAAVAGCPFSAPSVSTAQGLFANPARFGNGFGSFVIPASPAPVFFGAWFTGLPDRTPTWYILQGELRDNQVSTPIFRFRRTSDAPFQVSRDVVGEAQVVLTEPDRHWVWWSLGGRQGLEPVSLLYPGARPSGHRTQAWFHPPEAGWGVVFDEHLLSGQRDLVNIAYLYGGDGTARWSLGDTLQVNGATIAQRTFLVHCPSCPSFADFGSFPLPAGSLTHAFSGASSGQLSLDLSWPAAVGGSFRRLSPLPIQPLAPPP